MQQHTGKAAALIAALAGFALGACSDSGPRITTGTAGPRAGEAAPTVAKAPAPMTENKAGNTPPSIDFLEFDPPTPSPAMEMVRVVVDASDADGDALFFHYVWTVDGEAAGDGSPRLALAGLERGQRIEVRVTANDGKAQSRVASRIHQLGNSPPEITKITTDAPDGIVADSEVTAIVEAHDSDGDPVSFRYAWTINGRRARETGPTLSTHRVRRGDAIQVTATPSDGEMEGASFPSEVWTAVNSAPRIVSVPGEVGIDGVFRYAIAVEDPDGDLALSLSLDGAPPGVSIDPTTQTLHWAPSEDQVGVHTFSIVASDGKGGSGSQQVEVRIAAPAEAAPAAVAQ